MKKSELRNIIKEELKKINEDKFLNLTQKYVKKLFTDHLDAFVEDFGEHFSDLSDDEYDVFISDFEKLINKLKPIVNSYNFKSIKK